MREKLNENKLHALYMHMHAGGNPPANVTWYKDGVQIGGIGKKERTLNLSNVDNTASGTYKCVAQSHVLKDQKTIKLIVYCK